MITVIQRSERDTAGIGEGSPYYAVVRGSFCKGLAGWVHLYYRGGTRRHERLLAALRRSGAKNSPLFGEGRRSSAASGLA
jgi:hypothetical protein